MRDKILIEMGGVIQKARELKNITIEQISKEINVTEEVIREIENGRLDDSSIRVKIFDYLGLGFTDNSKIPLTFDDFD